MQLVCRWRLRWLRAFCPSPPPTLPHARVTPATPMPSGIARVIDGDTISIGEVRIRLEGIDAPEAGQTCQGRGGVSWPCGSGRRRRRWRSSSPADRCAATGAAPTSTAARWRVCFVRGRDVNAEMVRQGYAWAFVKYSIELREGGSRRQGRAAAASGRARPRPPGTIASGTGTRAETQAPNGCAIKGNITKSGRIYHMPWSPWYAPDQDGAGQGQTLVLQRGRGHRRRLAAGAKRIECRRTEEWSELERAMGIEPTTPTLARSCSTAELHPHPVRRPDLCNKGRRLASMPAGRKSLPSEGPTV